MKKVKVIRDDARPIIEMATRVLRPALSTAAPRPLSAAAARVDGVPAAAQWACAMCVQKSMQRPRESMRGMSEMKLSDCTRKAVRKLRFGLGSGLG